MSARAHVCSFAIAAFVAAIPLACSKRAAPTQSSAAASSSASGTVVDERLLAYLSLARSLHHDADLHEDASETEAAIGDLEKIVGTPPPQRTPEVDEVLADTYARLGELRASLDDYDRAEKDVDAGLLLAPDVSYFRGHLFEVRGVVEQRRMKSLLAKGDEPGASKAKKAAADAYAMAVTIQGEVIERGAQSSVDGGKP